VSIQDLVESMNSIKPERVIVNNIEVSQQQKQDYLKTLNNRQEKESVLPRNLKTWLGMIPKGNKIIDIGCGLGYTTMWISENKGTAIGIDEDPTVIKRAKDLHNYEHFYCDKYHRLNFKDNNFDSVFCYDAMKNQDNILACMSEMKRILKNEGLLFFIMPLYGLNVKPAGLYKWMPQTKEEVENVIKNQGFRILDSEQIDSLEKLGVILTQSNNQIIFIKAIK